MDVVWAVVTVVVLVGILVACVWAMRHRDSRLARGVAAGGQTYNRYVGNAPAEDDLRRPPTTAGTTGQG